MEFAEAQQLPRSLGAVYTDPAPPSPTSLRDLRAAVWRRKWSLVLPALFILCMAAAVALVLPPVYQSSATILLQKQEIPSDFVKGTVTSYAEQAIETIKQRILSFSVLVGLVKEFNLYQDLQKKQTMDQIVVRMRKDIGIKAVQADVHDRRGSRDQKVTIAFTLSYEGHNPDKVQKVTTRLTSLFLAENREMRERQTRETTQFLGDEMNKVKLDLGALNAKIADFKRKHLNELPELLQVNQQSLHSVEINLERLREQLRNLKERKEALQVQLASIVPEQNTVQKTQLAELEVRLADLTARFSEKHPDVIKTRAEIAQLEKQVRSADPLVQENRLTQLQIKLANLKTRFSDKHPDVIKTRAEIAELKKEMARVSTPSPGMGPANPAYVTLSSQLAATETDMESVKRQIIDLEKKDAVYRDRIKATPKVEEEYGALALEQQNTQAKYTDLMKKYMEARVAHGLEKDRKGERFTLIDPARYPEKPIKPNRLAILLIGLVLGIGAGVGTAALREYSDDSVRDVKRLASATTFHVLAAIPEIATKGDILRRRLKRGLVTATVLLVAAGGLAAVHFEVMDLNILWSKILTKFSLLFL